MTSRAKTATILPNLKSSSLVSLGQICDDNCTVVMDKSKLVATKSNKIKVSYKNQDVLLKGIRNPTDGLYDVNIPTRKKQSVLNINTLPMQKLDNLLESYKQQNTLISKTDLHPIQVTNPSLNVILRKNQTKQQLVTFLHRACCCPTTQTWTKAIQNNHFTTWPGLTVSLVRKHLSPSIATAKGHLKQERQGLQSTKAPPPSTDDDFFPLSPEPNIKSNQAIYSIIDSPTKAYSDLTGKFPVQSSRGNNYIFVCYHPDANAILARPIKN